MFTIQAGSKFVRVRYYIDPNEIFDFSISGQPNIYRTQKAAEQDLQRLNTWIDSRIQWTEQQIADTERSIARAEAELVKQEAKLESLLDLPYREVFKRVDNARRAIERSQSAISGRRPSIRSYRADLARYNKIKSAGSAVVSLQQSAVDAVAA